jgi:hypothetical protein
MTAAKETTLNELGEMLAHVVERMATKEDMRSIVAEGLASVLGELGSIQGHGLSTENSTRAS